MWGTSTQTWFKLGKLLFVRKFSRQSKAVLISNDVKMELSCFVVLCLEIYFSLVFVLD